MSLVELLQRMSELRTPVLLVAFISPFVVRMIPIVWRSAGQSGGYARSAAAFVACGLVTLTFSLAGMVYFHKTGTDLARDVDLLLLLAPLWFGGGLVYAGTRVHSFSYLRRYPVLRRVWSVLMAGLVLFGIFVVLRHTYWVVFSGILGFVVVAVVAWTLLSTLAERALEPGDEEPEELLDEVARKSRQRLARLSDAAVGETLDQRSTDEG